MPSLNLTSEQFRTSSQSIQSRYVRIELLNYQFQTVDSLEGNCIGGSITIDANSDVRRTGNITLVVNNSSFEVQPGGKIWLDKYLRIYVGTYGLASGEISWTNCGLFIIDAPSYHYDIASNTLTISLLDLMAKLTGTRNGYLKGLPTIIKAGENIRSALISTLELGGFTKYIVENPPAPGKVPNDLEFGQGSTVYDLLKGLVDIYPGYEMFFDINGTFIYQKIPDGESDPVMIDDTLWDSIVISEDFNVDFQKVKNSIEVYGRSHDPARFSANTVISGNNIHLEIADVYQYFNVVYGFTLTNSPGYTDMTLEINELGKLPITLEDGVTRATIPSEQGEVLYCVQYAGDHFNWLGHVQAYGFAEDTNVNSPFYVGGTVGRIRLPLFGGEYDNIYTDDLARQRAQYELYLHSNMNNTLNLNCVPVYWMDVNLLVEYTSKANKEKEKYIIKSVNLGLAESDSMTINMIKFYPESPSIVTEM